MTEYAEREIDSDELAPHYSKHVMAMTAEILHSKSDIAAELAWRDAEIERVKAKLAFFQGEVDKLNSVLEKSIRLSEQRGEERDAAADYAQDQAAVMDLVAKALGVPDEPHQGRAERILEAAEEKVNAARLAERFARAKGRHHSQRAMCDLLEHFGLPCTRPRGGDDNL